MEGKNRQPIRIHCFLLGLLLIPINCYWIMQIEVNWYAGHPTTISLFFNAMLFMVLVAIINGGVRFLLPKLAFNSAELVTIYAMVCMASAMGGHDMIQVLTPMLTFHQYGANPENNYAELFSGNLPEQLLVVSEDAIRNFHEGSSSLYLPENYRPWIRPVLLWTGFLTVLVFTTMCLNVLFLKEWTQNERLTFPIVEVPLTIATDPGRICWNSRFFIAFGIAAFISTVNGLNHLYPDDVPLIPVRWQRLRLFIDLGRPWDAFGEFPVSWYPCVIGLSYLMPIDLMFSCWFFFFVWRFQQVFVSSLGITPLLPADYINQQATGAYMAIAVGAFWIGRKHLKEVWAKVIYQKGLPDGDEPLPYRVAAAGVLLGFSALVGFSNWAGLSLALSLAYFLVYLFLAIGIARMRATCGPPAHDLHFAGPGEFLSQTIGTEHMDGQSLGVMTLFFGFNRAYRGHPMAHSLEAFRLGQQTNANQRLMFFAQLLAVFTGCICAFWALVHIGYDNVDGAKYGFAYRPYARLARWLQYPQEVNWLSYLCYAAGFIVVMLMPLLKVLWTGLPFHPIGYAVSSSWSMQLVWLPIMIGWVCKLSIVKYLGGRGYRHFLPFFVGLILGDYVVGGMWCLASLAVGRGMYAFWY